MSASDTHSKVDLFNSFFNSVFSCSDFILPPMSQLPTPSNHLSSIDVSSINVSSEDVYTALSSLDPTKAFGCDQISPRLLTLCAGSIVESVTILFRESLTNGCLPDEWKIHKITPIFKSGDSHSVTNYRPISLLCILSKVLESIVYSKIIPFLRTLLCRQQFGFLKNCSALSQLLVSFSSIMQHCENGH